MTALDAPCRLPVPRPGQVLGLVGTNGIGKSTALKVRGGGAASEEEGGERASTQERCFIAQGYLTPYVSRSHTHLLFLNLCFTSTCPPVPHIPRTHSVSHPQARSPVVMCRSWQES